MNETQQLNNRPSQVSKAIGLLWFSLGLAFVNVLTDPEYLVLDFITTLTVFILGIRALVIWKVSVGRNWARIFTLVMFLLSGLAYLVTLTSTFSGSRLIGLSVLLQLAFELVALYLIFTEPGAGWFKRGQPEESFRLNS